MTVEQMILPQLIELQKKFETLQSQGASNSELNSVQREMNITYEKLRDQYLPQRTNHLTMNEFLIRFLIGLAFINIFVLTFSFIPSGLAVLIGGVLNLILQIKINVRSINKLFK